MDIRNRFSTRTDQRWYAFYAAVICLALGVAAGSFMWVWLHIPGPVILVGGTFVLMAPAAVLALTRQQNVPLHFYDDHLQIFHLDGLIYNIDHVPARVFRFRQNALERKYDVGRLKVKGTQFYLYGVQHFEETRRYILENFSDC